jgi:type II secretory pathway component GspD/PulD (secretin)
MNVSAAPKFSARLLAFTALALLAGSACAQATPSAVTCPDTRTPGTIYRTFYLSQDISQQEFTEVQTVLRNELPGARINGIPEQSTIAICGTTAELDLAQKIVSDLDQAPSSSGSWRLTYTFTSGPVSHTATFTVASGEDGVLKQGKRVPIVTGTSNGSDQYQYVDIGIGISARVENSGGALRLKTKVEQSELTGQKAGANPADPVIFQTVLDTVSLLHPGKPQVLGTLNLPDGEQQVSVTAEPVP